MKKLYFIIGCDSDPDRPGFVPGVTEEGRSWRGLAEGPLRLKESIRDLKDSTGKTAKITWVLRVDEQVKLLYGDYAWVLGNYKEHLLNLEKDGDELGWHPHFYRYHEPRKKWYQELHDINWQVEMLNNAHAAYMKELPGRAKSVRTGWIYHNNNTMQKLSELNVRIDFSAIPGLRTKHKATQALPYNIFDWYISPKEPYFPSMADYRRQAAEGETSLPTLEIPNFTSDSVVWSLISGLQFTRKMKNAGHMIDAVSRPTYWINITGVPKLFSPIASSLQGVLKKTDRPIVFATYFHADELLDTGSSLYSLSSMKTNIKTLLEICTRENFTAEFITASAVPDLIHK